MNNEQSQRKTNKEYEFQLMLAKYMASEINQNFFNDPSVVEQRMLLIEKDIAEEKRSDAEPIVLSVLIQARNTLAYFLGKELWPEVEVSAEEMEKYEEE